MNKPEIIKSKTIEELEKYKGDPFIDLMLEHLPSDYEYKAKKDYEQILYEGLKEKYGL